MRAGGRWPLAVACSDPAGSRVAPPFALLQLPRLLAHRTPPLTTPACSPWLQAVELGLDHGKRLSLRRRLQAARLTCPLFDTAGWVRGFELTLLRMWEIHCQGGGPTDFEVEPEGPAAAAAAAAALAGAPEPVARAGACASA